MRTLILIIITTITILTGASFKGHDQTLKNLQNAYLDEANASRKYQLYSIKAEQEGYGQIAKLFRAVSKSESIHMRNHKRVIENLGATPEAIVFEKVNVKTTKENLIEPIKDEGKETDYTYPNYIQEAKKDNVQEAVNSFKFAQKSEGEHKELLKDALSDLGKNAPEDYYVSKVSGETFAVSPKEKSELISEDLVKVN